MEFAENEHAVEGHADVEGEAPDPDERDEPQVVAAAEHGEVIAETVGLLLRGHHLRRELHAEQEEEPDKPHDPAGGEDASEGAQ